MTLVKGVKYSPRQKYFCPDCGTAVYISKDSHEAGRMHYARGLVLQALEDPSITLQEIADALGVSRQRVHQIAKKLRPDWNKWEARRLYWQEIKMEKDEQKWDRRYRALSESTTLSALQSKCKQLGIEFEYYEVSPFYAVLNGKKCRVRKGYMFNPRNKRHMRIGNPGSPNADTEFFLVQDPVIADDWWIFPADFRQMWFGSSWTREDTVSDYYVQPRPENTYLKFKNAWQPIKGRR